MSCNKDADISEAKSEKPVKRVRFSEEIQNVYEYERDENNENLSLENESFNTSNEFHNLEQDEFSTEEAIKNLMDSDDTITTVLLSETCDGRVDELIRYNKTGTITDDLCKDDCHQQCNTSSAHSDSPLLEHLNNNNNNPDMVDLNLLIQETEQMTISSSDQVQEISLFSEGFSVCSSYESCAEKDVLQVAMQSIEQNSDTSNFTRKRSSEGMLVERQTSKLNSCLRNENSEINSAVDLKNTVFNAWNKIKRENASGKNATFVPEIKEKITTLPRRHEKFENRKEGRWKNSKRKAKKIRLKVSEPVSQKKKEDIEESEMAFRAWKKKKDELLNQHIAEKRKKEEKKRLDALTNERMRKNDAESAYLAWISHKAVVVKMEKKKNQWLLERENEKLNEKIKRNDEAAKIYYKWLRSKIFLKRNSHNITENKPPWTPPGKVNSLI